MVKGSKVCSKGGRVRKCVTLNCCRLKGMLERMVEGSKARSKGGRVRKRTSLNGCRLKGMLERKRGLKGALEKK
jgi:hypothetical protein